MGGSMTGLLVIGGEAPGRASVEPYLAEDPFVVAADSGVQTALALGIRVDLVVGDMDSLNDPAILDRFPAERVLRFPQDKDETDTEIGLRLLGERGLDRVVVVGGGGGRLDHFLGVHMLFERAHPPQVWLTDTAVLVLLTGSRVLDATPSEVLSFFPVGAEAHVRRTRGLRWPLDGLRLRRGYASLSNEATSDKIEVEVALGGLILVRSI